MDVGSVQGASYYVALARQARTGTTAPTENARAPRQIEQGTEARRPEQSLNSEERRVIRELQQRDREVRAHEQAHRRAGGAHAGPPQYEFIRGPDGQRYAVSGSVSIDSSPVRGDPEATLEKMETVQRAAMAPAEPSGRDLAVAARASALIQQARAEMQSGHEKAGPTNPSDRLMERLDRSGAIREPAEQGQLIDTRG